ncbi:MAG: hypothetical protein QXD11_02260 [Candidatus Micrarchaeaceae archaeon]
MEIPKEIMAYCSKCNKHTLHTVKLYVKGAGFGIGMNIGNRRRQRKLEGYHGKVKGQAIKKKVSQRQKVILTCNECNYSIEKVFGTRTKKKLEIVQ